MSDLKMSMNIPIPEDIVIVHTAYLIAQFWTNDNGKKIIRISTFSEEHPSMITNAGYHDLLIAKETGSSYQEALDKLKERIVITV